ncbi:MAG: hypothetical protein ACO38K_09005 [Ilumatobacteraceae bacterium]
MAARRTVPAVDGATSDEFVPVGAARPAEESTVRPGANRRRAARVGPAGGPTTVAVAARDTADGAARDDPAIGDTAAVDAEATAGDRLA